MNINPNHSNIKATSQRINIILTTWIQVNIFKILEAKIKILLKVQRPKCKLDNQNRILIFIFYNWGSKCVDRPVVLLFVKIRLNSTGFNIYSFQGFDISLHFMLCSVPTPTCSRPFVQPKTPFSANCRRPRRSPFSSLSVVLSVVVRRTAPQSSTVCRPSHLRSPARTFRFFQS